MGLPSSRDITLSDQARWRAAMAGLPTEAPEPTTPWLNSDLVIKALTIVAVGATFLCAAMATTVHYCDALAVVAVALVPVELVATTFFLQDHPLSLRRLVARLTEGDWRGRINVAVALPLVSIGLPATSVLLANQRLDRSPGVTRDLPVTALWERHSRNSTTYLAGVALDVPAPPRLTPFYDTQPIDVGARLYARLTVGDRLRVTIHPGLFGFAWVERRRLTKVE